MKKLTTKARAQITVEINLRDEWGEDCSVEQVNKQATSTAINIINNAVHLLRQNGHMSNISIIGLPKIIATITEN